jgi:hypothetical protein
VFVDIFQRLHALVEQQPHSDQTNYEKVDCVAVPAQKYLIAWARKSLSVLFPLAHADRKRGDHPL